MTEITKELLLQKFDSGMHYILLDQNTTATLTNNGNNRVLCRMNNQLEFHCAVMPKKEGGHFINVGSIICKKLGIQEGSKVTASFTVDDTPYQFEMPIELEEVLNTDEQANKLFHGLTSGNQRSLIYLVTQVKSSEKRIERALKIAAKIKNGITSPKVILK